MARASGGEEPGVYAAGVFGLSIIADINCNWGL